MPLVLNRNAMRRARISRGWSLRQLGEASGVSYQTVANAENGRRIPYPANLKAIADALEVDITELLADEA